MDPFASLVPGADPAAMKPLQPPPAGASPVSAPAPLRGAPPKRRAADRRRLQALRYCVGHRLRLARAQSDDGVAEALLQHAAHDAFVLMLAGALTHAQWERIRSVLRAERLRRTAPNAIRSARATAPPRTHRPN